MSKRDLKPLIGVPLKVVNVGLEGFADDLRNQKVEVAHVDWQPPARGNAELAKLLSKLGT